MKTNDSQPLAAGYTKTFTYEHYTSALGGLCMNFQTVENRLLELLCPLVNKKDERIGVVIGSQLSFRKLCDVVDALCRLRTHDEKILEVLESVLQECGRIEDERNKYVHSFYDLLSWGGDQMVFERTKRRIRRGKGYVPDYETHDPEKLDDLSSRMVALSGQIDDFGDMLREKDFIPPIPPLVASDVQ